MKDVPTLTFEPAQPRPLAKPLRPKCTNPKSVQRYPLLVSVLSKRFPVRSKRRFSKWLGPRRSPHQSPKSLPNLSQPHVMFHFSNHT